VSRRRNPAVRPTTSSGHRGTNESDRDYARPLALQMGARLHLLDPAGHRLVEYSARYDDDPMQVQWSGVGRSTWIGADDPDGEWTKNFFACKTCRDQGQPFLFAADLDAVNDALTPLWEEGRALGRERYRPRHVEMNARAASEDDLR